MVDEAQDISPIEFKLLQAASANNWFTILGDTAQRLTPYRGIRRWRDVERVFGRSEIKVQHARRTYRSTKRITEFNNRILRTFESTTYSPLPFERDGHRVEYSKHGNTDSMYRGVSDDIDRIRTLDGLANATIAILIRDRLNLNRFQQFREHHGLETIPMVDNTRLSRAQTVLGRISDMKGLEFDAVMVLGVNDSFSDTEFNKKMLYLATTRAKHYLGIHWSGRQSPILRSISSRGLRMYRT